MEYQEIAGLWVVSLVDELGQLGESVADISRYDAIFRLGVELGRNPQKFARPLGEYFGEAANAK
jgi:hypothetical protein